MVARKNIISIIISILCIGGIIIMIAFYNTVDIKNLPNDFAIVFDAGSSNTRMYIYQWTAGFSAAKGDKLRITQNLSCNTNDGGLDKTKSRKDLESKFSSCIQQAKNIIPNKRKSRAYIFLAATAGMRLLDARNKTASNEIFSYVRDYFQSLEFLFKNSSQARILSGQEEGTNAWISANYFENNFETHKSIVSYSFGTKRRLGNTRTKGILDLGGASTQITYVPYDSNSKYTEFFTEIKIYGIKYKTYSHSFLCWGINQITLLYQTLLINKNNYSKDIVASCFPTGSNVSLSADQILDSPCANGLLFNYTYNFTVNSSLIDQNNVFNFNGESNRESCEKQVQIILPKPKCNYDTCSFDGVYQPTLNKSNFLGFSNIYYAVSNTAKLFKKEVDDLILKEFQNLTILICSSNFEELKELNINSNAGLSDSYLINQCFANNYVIQLLISYGFKSFDNLKMTDKINGYSLNWALGYMINELNRDDFLPYEELPRKLKLPAFVTLTILLSLACLLTLTYIIYPKVKAKYLTKTEEIPFSRKRNDQTDIDATNE